MGNRHVEAADHQVTDEDIAGAKPGLSEEERAALAEPDDEGGEPKSGAGPDDAKPDETGSPQDGGTGEAAGAGTGDSQAAGGEGEGEGVVQSEEEIPRGKVTLTQLSPSREIDPAQVDERLGAIDTEQAELDQRYNDSEIDATEYLRQSRALTREQAQLEADKREAAFIERANADLAKGDWDRAVSAFLEANTQFQTPVMQGALNAALNELYADAANEGASFAWYLETAKRQVRAELGLGQSQQPPPPKSEAPAEGEGATGATADAAATAAAKAAADKAADARDKLPKTLGDAPSAHKPDTGGDQFAAIDQLDGMELEARLARMTPEEQEKYLRA